MLENWKYPAGIAGMVAFFRALWSLAISIAVAPWERDQHKAQIKILEARINSLEEILEEAESRAPSRNSLLNEQDSTPTSIPSKLRSSRR